MGYKYNNYESWLKEELNKNNSEIKFVPRVDTVRDSHSNLTCGIKGLTNIKNIIFEDDRGHKFKSKLDISENINVESLRIIGKSDENFKFTFEELVKINESILGELCIKDCHFKGVFILKQSKVNKIKIENCIFEKDVNLENIKMLGLVKILNCTFKECLNIESIGPKPVDLSKGLDINDYKLRITDNDSWRKLPTFWDDIIATVTHIFQNIKAKSLTINLIPKIWQNCWIPSKSKCDRFSHDKEPEKYVFLKKYYKNQGDVKRELEYSFMELEAEYQRLSWVCFSKEFPFFISARKIPFFFYRWFSLYGSSIIRPLIWILIFLLLSELFNNGLDLFANLRSLSWLKTTAILNKLSIIFPILNIESAEINNVPDALLSLVSIPLLFLFGLGLRNRFKLQ